MTDVQAVRSDPKAERAEGLESQPGPDRARSGADQARDHAAEGAAIDGRDHVDQRGRRAADEESREQEQHDALFERSAESHAAPVRWWGAGVGGMTPGRWSETGRCAIFCSTTVA